MNYIILFTTIISINLIFFYNFTYISNKIKIYDKPDYHLKNHKESVSLLGGLVILINLYLITFLLFILNIEDLFFVNNFIYIIIILSTAFYLIGLIDDLKNLNPNLKLILIILAISIILNIFPDLSLRLIKISFLDKNYYFNNYSSFFIILSFALLLNALNMFDGINLQLISFSIFIFCLFIAKGFVPIFFLLLLIPMIIIGFLNFKNKIFLGDGGSFLIGAIMGSTFIYQYKNYDNFLYGDEIFIILLVPALDMLRLFVLRIINRKNPFKGDLNHLHHLVNDITHDKNKTIFLTLTLCIFPSICLILALKTFYILALNLIIYFSFLFYIRSKKK